MRIISGVHRGRHIIAPKYFKLRPTTDNAKEGLFNILANEIDFDDSSLLDLFTGIGSITFEFASRGCTDIVSVERDHKHTDFLKEVSKTLKIEGHKILSTDVRDFLKIAHRSFDVIFADPPYDLPWIQEIPNMIYASQAFHADTVVIIEHPGEVSYAEHPCYSHTRNYGKVHFSWFYTSERES